MALVVFLRGVNVGGHRTFRPSVLARELSEYDVVNVQATVASKSPGGSASQAAIRSGRDAVRRARPSAPGNGESVWDSALPAEWCSFREHPLEGGRRPRIATSFVSLRWPVVGAGDGVRRPVRVWHVPAPNEDHRLPRPDRQTLRPSRHDTDLEHDRCYPANLEGPQQPAVTGKGALPRGFECNGDV